MNKNIKELFKIILFSSCLLTVSPLKAMDGSLDGQILKEPLQKVTLRLSDSLQTIEGDLKKANNVLIIKPYSDYSTPAQAIPPEVLQTLEPAMKTIQLVRLHRGSVTRSSPLIARATQLQAFMTNFPQMGPNLLAAISQTPCTYLEIDAKETSYAEPLMNLPANTSFPNLKKLLLSTQNPGSLAFLGEHLHRFTNLTYLHAEAQGVTQLIPQWRHEQLEELYLHDTTYPEKLEAFAQTPYRELPTQMPKLKHFRVGLWDDGEGQAVYIQRTAQGIFFSFDSSPKGQQILVGPQQAALLPETH